MKITGGGSLEGADEEMQLLDPFRLARNSLEGLLPLPPCSISLESLCVHTANPIKALTKKKRNMAVIMSYQDVSLEK